jgi:cytochrome c oxidase subunit 2
MTTQTDQAHEHWIDPYERIWMGLSIMVLAILFTAVSIASMGMGIQVPSPEGRVDPRTVTESGPFSEPGLRDLGNGQYEAYILGQTWNWQPNKITVPVGSTVTFYITSKDVQHGVLLWDTNLNIMVLPGHISRAKITFDKPGEYPFICHEYCGVGHHTMAGKVIVE